MNLLYYFRNTVKTHTAIKYVWDKVNACIAFILFYLVREGLFGTSDLDLKPDIDHYKVGFLKPSDIMALASHPEVEWTAEKARERLSNGCLCFGFKHKGDVAAYSWVNINRSESEFISFPLKEHEAFLFDAMTFRAYRGKNIAPCLRYELYRELEKLGHTDLISITGYFNVNAIKFKKKLKARPQKLYLRVVLFRKFGFNMVLRTYRHTP